MTVLTSLRNLALATCAGALLAAGCVQAAPPATTMLRVDASARATAFPHFWERMFGSGRASLALRDDYRKDLVAVREATGFGYVRFHGIFDRDVGLVRREPDGRIAYNFSYVDQIYDGLLERGVKPFVELGFMPEELTSDPKAIHAFWYHPNVAPPRDYAEWDAMIAAFARHLVGRYGIDEVASWYFEVWNEPNIGFWTGSPAQSAYFTLYDHTARALKAVSPRLRVGGPATAQAAWIPDFLAHVHKDKVPVDFVSTHVYGDDTADNVFHTREAIPRADMVCRAVDKVHREIAASPYPRMPLVFSEYNASYANLPNVTDTVYMGPWMANTIRECAGKVDLMSYWSFSDVFEEQGVVRNPFYGGFGLIAANRIAKPAFNAFAMLHRLGEERLAVDSDAALVTRRGDGTLVLALWNYAPEAGNTASYTPGQPAGAAKHFAIAVRHLPAAARATVWRLDATHGNAVAAFDRMGRPDFPSREQIAQLRKAAQPAAPEHLDVRDGKLELDIPPQGLAVIELR
ncbi:glycosyl hydrolase family 39 [Frateuria sp. Soil773]|uniref:GH39 family glycosyl hydrolase n=1 Tax=Frateuria sp. Soil773 TaxID=1736407 RepID=UPI0006F5A2AD|nr:glycosyl hydrolase family 39 [Frateuria sp. Soil773]KRE89190.1 glycosyl hydrolase family 39 [Frateuria sp. Soil773]